MSVVLAAVATLGYVLGRRGGCNHREVIARSNRELYRAQSVAGELEKIASLLRESLSRHQESLTHFKHRVSQLIALKQEAAGTALRREAEQMLGPTLELATQIANARDLIRQQTGHLPTFPEVRTDPLTGVSNRRGLEDALAAEFANLSRYGHGFSVAIFDIDHFGHLNDERGPREGDRLIEHVGRLLDDSVRETDVAARSGVDEFVVVMPQTDLEQASTSGERFRAMVEKRLPLTVSGGVATVLDGDTADSLLRRAEAALHGAKAAGGNGIFRHDGQRVESIWEEVPAAAKGL